MRAACFLVAAFVHAAFADNHITVNEGYTRDRDSHPALGEHTGVLAYDRLLSRLPGTARISGQHLLEGPIYIQVPRADGHLATYFADQGLGSVMSEPILRPIRDLLLQDESKGKIQGLVYRPATYQDPHLLEINAREIYIPDDIKIGDYLAVLVRNQQIPILLIGEENFFNDLKLDGAGIKYIGKVSVAVEPSVKFIQP